MQIVITLASIAEMRDQCDSALPKGPLDRDQALEWNRALRQLLGATLDEAVPLLGALDRYATPPQELSMNAPRRMQPPG